MLKSILFWKTASKENCQPELTFYRINRWVLLSKIAFKIAVLLCINNLEFKMAIKVSNMADHQTKHNPKA